MSLRCQPQTVVISVPFAVLIHKDIFMIALLNYINLHFQVKFFRSPGKTNRFPHNHSKYVYLHMSTMTKNPGPDTQIPQRTTAQKSYCKDNYAKPDLEMLSEEASQQRGFCLREVLSTFKFSHQDLEGLQMMCTLEYRVLVGNDRNNLSISLPRSQVRKVFIIGCCSQSSNSLRGLRSPIRGQSAWKTPLLRKTQS